MKNILAQVDYEPLAPIPQLLKEGSGTMATTESFLGGIVPLVIGVAAGLAVIMIVVGGIKYMTTDAFMGKKDAKDTIRNAFMGLLLAISSYVLLNTINPKLVAIDLTFPSIPTGEGFASTTSQTRWSAYETGCRDDCEAIDPDDIPLKPNGAACKNDPCYLNEDLIDDLKDLVDGLEDKVDWQVTEAFPPTVQHASSCHKPNRDNSGACVDVALISQTTPANIKIFLTAIEEIFDSYQYEVCNEQKYNQLRADPNLSTFRNRIVQCPGTATGEHAHINKNE